jgi:LuxR family maltose regulon positive regulatory protein
METGHAQGRPGSLVAGKCAPPVPPERLVGRPRLEAELAQLLRAHRLVDITATAGAGKTTMVLQGTRALGRPVAWLTLDDTDTAPGRLLTYLDAAIRRAVPDTPVVVPQALAAGVLHPEAAALLAEAIPDVPLVLVVDEVERIADAPDATAVLSSLIRYTRPAVTTILVGRRAAPVDVLSRFGFGEVGSLNEEGLAFDVEEAAEALELQGLGAVDVPRVVEAVGGWVAGVLFEAWRSDKHVGGSGGEADPLAGFLAVQILERLDDAEREFLIVTSLLDDVDRDRAAALGVDDAGELLERLRQRHLPATFRDGGQVLRCHPRFREYLRTLLERRGRAELEELRRRHGDLLQSEGRHEEAVEELLAAGCPDEAVACAEAAMPDLLARRDLELAQRWLDRFQAAGHLDGAGLLAAQLSIAIAREDFTRAVTAADRLQVLADGDAELMDPEGRALAAWAYWHVGRLDDARAMHVQSSGRVSDLVQYLFSLVDAAPPVSIPASVGGPVDAVLLRIAYVRGRLVEVRAAPVSAWTPAATERIAAHRALGELERTQEMLASGVSFLSNLRFEGTVRAELLMDLGREAEAREALAAGRERITRSGSFVFDIVMRLLEAKLELRLRRDATAAEVILAHAAAAGPVRDYGYLAEQLDLWLGYTCLLQDRDAEAVQRLRSAVDTMASADRILELPTAAVYLSEAQWRVGATEEADAAAELALETAGRQGSRHLMLQALDDVPSVLARQLDAEESPDGPWHDVASSAVRRRSGRAVAAARLHLRDIGAPKVLVDGAERKPRITKTYALLAYLLQAGGTASRRELLDAIFDGRADDSARAYLRQAAQGLRQLLHEGLELETVDGGFRLSDPTAVTTDSALLDMRMDYALSLTGSARVDAIQTALTGSDRGPYLDGIECAFVRERRADLATRVNEARMTMAISAYEESRYELAEAASERVVAEDPFRERGWRLLMRIAAARGREEAIVEIYRRCELALEEVGLEPSAATRQLAAGLRR